MSPSDLLVLMVEASLALAGFAGVVAALSNRSAEEHGRIDRMIFGNLLFTSLGALFLSLAALALIAAGIGEGAVWRSASAIGLVFTSLGGVRSIAAVARELGAQQVRRMGLLYVINVPILFVCLAQAWNALAGGVFWPVFVLLVAWFGLACLSFVLLLYGARYSSSPGDFR